MRGRARMGTFARRGSFRGGWGGLEVWLDSMLQLGKGDGGGVEWLLFPPGVCFSDRLGSWEKCKVRASALLYINSGCGG